MNYVVSWFHSAENHLAAIWLRASDRAGVTAAAAAIDAALSQDADVKGIAWIGPYRVLQVSPLGVGFRVDQAAGLVRVLTVWELRDKVRANGPAPKP